MDLRARPDGGFTSVQFVAAAALSMVLFVMAANFIVFQYGRGAVRAAVDEGARAGSVETATAADCRRRAYETLGELLAGSLGRHVSITCARVGDMMVASADVRFRSWIPPVPDWAFSVVGTARKERAPG